MTIYILVETKLFQAIHFIIVLSIHSSTIRNVEDVRKAYLERDVAGATNCNYNE